MWKRHLAYRILYLQQKSSDDTTWSSTMTASFEAFRAIEYEWGMTARMTIQAQPKDMKTSTHLSAELDPRTNDTNTNASDASKIGERELSFNRVSKVETAPLCWRQAHQKSDAQRNQYCRVTLVAGGAHGGEGRPHVIFKQILRDTRASFRTRWVPVNSKEAGC